MPSITYVQGNEFANGSSTTINLSYTGPNTAGNFGVVWAFTSNGQIPSGITDTQGNSWCPITSYSSNIGEVGCWVCMKMKSGANTVTANFANSAIEGTPSLHILEYAYTGTPRLIALQPIGNNDVNLSAMSAYLASISSGVAQSVMINLFMGLYDLGSAHGWTGESGTTGRVGTVEGGLATTVSGDAFQTLGTDTFATIGFLNTSTDPSPFNNRYCGFCLVLS